MPSKEHDSIQQWFLKNLSDVNKEVPLKTWLTKRADIVINKKIAVEIQCTSITLAEYEERNLNYVLNNLIPVWVFGKDFYEHARKKRRYGTYIKLVEVSEYEKWGCFYHHNKYDLFRMGFELKQQKGSYDYCGTKGWYVFEKIGLPEFIASVEAYID